MAADATFNSATVDPDPTPPLRLDSIPTIDLRLLSQSELYSLSKTSNSSLELNRCDDVVIPKINRSIFNESAGSRKQTYSRLRLAPAESSASPKTTIHRRTPHLRSSYAHTSNNINDPEQAENSQIIRLLKELFKSDPNFEDLVPIEVETDTNVAIPELSNHEIKRKRGRPRKHENADPNFEDLVPIVVETNTDVVIPESSNPEITRKRGRPLKNENADPKLEDLVPIEVETDTNVVIPELSNPEITRKRGRPRKNENADPKLEDLVPIEVETDTNVVIPELSNPEIKRKRGRPRKHENPVFIHPPVAKRRRNKSVKKVVVFDNDRDREIMNSRGMKVNIMNLGRLEDPYGPEIRRRTEGMSTEDDLLGFLRGLNGRWGTRSEKKRVVDASDFGDALPKGWMLSLSIKKKDGRVWLFCRRYISPSGRQFESCKEASMYLLSVVGEENLHKPSHSQSNDCDDFALKGASGNAADLFICEDLKRNSAVINPIEPSISIPTYCEKQAKSDIVDAVDVQVEELFKCLKCFMIFEGKVDYLVHQTKAHNTEKSEVGSAISEWTVVEGGIFECQFCDKTFYERNQYNGHIRIHVTNENGTPEASEAPAAENVDPVLDTGVPDKELPVTISVESNVVMETHDACFDDKPISASSESDCKISSVTETTINELVHDLNMNGDALVKESGHEIGNNCNVDDILVPGRDKDPDFSVSRSGFCVSHEASMSINGSNGKFENSIVTVDSVDKLEHTHDQGTRSGGCLLSPSSNKGLGGASVIVEKNMVDMSNGQDSFFETEVMHVDKPECILEQERSPEKSHLSPFSNELMDTVGKNADGKFSSAELFDHAVSETRVQPSNIGENKGLQVNISDTHLCSSFDELTSEKEKVNSESSFGVFRGCLGVDQYRVAEVKDCSVSKSLSLVSPCADALNAANNANLISFEKRKSFQKVGFAGSTIAASDRVTHGFDENRFSCVIESSKVDGQHEFRRRAFDSYNTSSMNGVTSVEKEDNFTRHSPVSLWHEKECVNEDAGSRLPVSTIEEPRTHMNVEGFQTENDVKNASSNRLVETKLHDFQIFRNNKLINNEVASLGSSQDGLETNVMAFNTGLNLEFGFQDDVNDLYDSAQESVERGLLDHFCVSETSDDIFRNKIYSTPLDELKFDDDRGTDIHELSLTFGNPHAVYVDTIGSEQKKDGVHGAVMSSKFEDAFNVQTNLSMVNNSMVKDLKVGRDSVGGSFSLSCSNETRPFQHNSNTAYPGRSWENLRSDEFRSYENKKFMIGSGSNQHQHNKAASCDMWKTGEGNQLQGGLANPHAQIPSPSYFHSFDIMSDKADDGLFRVDERYADNGLRLGRSEPVEFRFLTSRSEHNSNAFQGGSRAFPYNTGMEQAYDSPFWMGRNAMIPNMAGRNLVTGVCAWCRNEFPFQAMAIHPETQAGVGSLCPTCSAGFSGQINML